MKRQVTRCDICGTDDSPDNRVCVKLTGLHDAPKLETFSYFSIASSGAEDVCCTLGGELMAQGKAAYPTETRRTARSTPTHQRAQAKAPLLVQDFQLMTDSGAWWVHQDRDEFTRRRAALTKLKAWGKSVNAKVGGGIEGPL